MHRNLFWAVEGMDGSGSTTQCKKLVDYLKKQGYDAVFTAEPSKGEIGFLLRDYLNASRQDKIIISKQCMALLFAADRLAHYDNEIKPLLEQGKFVVSDRYVLSSLVYQGISLDLDWVRKINKFAPAADFTVLIDVRDEVAAHRRQIRKGTVEIFDDLSVQSIIAKRYRELAGLAGAHIINGNGDEETVFAQLKALVP